MLRVDRLNVNKCGTLRSVEAPDGNTSCGTVPFLGTLSWYLFLIVAVTVPRRAELSSLFFSHLLVCVHS